MKLLFITQKLHGQDAFTALWVKAFIERGYEVTVLCLEWRPEEMKQVLGTITLPLFTVHSLGKEKGNGKVAQVLHFWKFISTLKYDRVFIHMTPVWGLLGAPIFIIKRAKVYLWYTHYKMQTGLWLLGLYGKRLFCATPQSLPQYQGSKKKVVTGHGIDLQYWPKRTNTTQDSKKLLGVFRLSRSKRVELCIRAMLHLPDEVTWDIYGIPAEQDYADELLALVSELQLRHRVRFHSSVPSKDLPALYTSHRLILNMASETIDKTMLEAMTCGCYPVTTKRNAEAIGLPAAPEVDSPEAIAAFIRAVLTRPPLPVDKLFAIVEERHSLAKIIETMDSYMQPGV